METNTNSRAPQSLVSFSAFNLLVFVSTVCVLLAIVNPFIRRQPPEVQPAIYSALAISAALALLAFLVICILRRRAEIQSGPLKYHPTPVGWIKWTYAALIIPMMIAMIVFLINVIGQTAALIEGTTVSMFSNFGMGWMMTLAIVVPIFFLTHAVTQIWWNVNICSLEVRENGLIVGGLRYIPWATIKELTWTAGSSKKYSVMSIKSHDQKTAIIKSIEKQTIDNLLQEQGIPVREK